MKTPFSPEYLSTTEVAAALGISVSTVKRWVEEGILPAQKTAGGHRKLLRTDVLEVARQNNLPVQDPSLLQTNGRARRAVSASGLEAHLFAALVEGDVSGVRRVVHGAYENGMSIETIADTLIAPAMHRVGCDWQAGRIDVMHEHRASQICVGVLHELKSVLQVRARRDRPVAVGGAPEGDLSELPTLLAQMVLLDASWAATNLGANTPMASFSRALSELKPRLMWISVSHLPSEEFPLRAYRQFYREAERAGVAVMVGGYMLVEPLRSTIPYTAYGDGLTHLAAFARTLHPTPRRPRRGRPAAD